MPPFKKISKVMKLKSPKLGAEGFKAQKWLEKGVAIFS